MEITLVLALHDHGTEPVSEMPMLFLEETTIVDLKKTIKSVHNIDENDQELFHEGVQIVSPNSTIRQLGFKEEDVIVVKHTALRFWVDFLLACEGVNDINEDMEVRRNFAQTAIDLSALLERSTFFVTHADLALEWMKKHGEAQRLIDPLLAAFKESAKEFFAREEPGSTIEVEPYYFENIDGVMAKVMNGDTPTRYYLKTYNKHYEAVEPVQPNLIETFVYRLLNYIDAGPIVHFPYISKSISLYSIMTRHVDGFQEFEQVKDAELQIKIVVEAYILRLVLGIENLDCGIFGVDKRNQLSIVDFCPPRRKFVLQRDITNGFKNENKFDRFDVCEILKEIEPEKRVEIAKVALDRWDGIRTVTSGLIDEEIAFFARQGVEFYNGTDDVEGYIRDIKANYEALRSGLQ
ncbi:hypothetical protein B9Z55_003838 [Caenorhabditis nigoni]|uniref:Ubiquitin-like domain-containing protein n=1 Tax=Caenorhabditis nigoni TaxID=1611254 RepID=A0A2G5VSR7_9PELO|nr:hypothetical protein B9Z55_003838 [Caenorhabditis nigoni]